MDAWMDSGVHEWLVGWNIHAPWIGSSLSPTCQPTNHRSFHWRPTHTGGSRETLLLEQTQIWASPKEQEDGSSRRTRRSWPPCCRCVAAKDREWLRKPTHKGTIDFSPHARTNMRFITCSIHGRSDPLVQSVICRLIK